MGPAVADSGLPEYKSKDYLICYVAVGDSGLPDYLICYVAVGDSGLPDYLICYVAVGDSGLPNYLICYVAVGDSDPHNPHITLTHITNTPPTPPHPITTTHHMTNRTSHNNLTPLPRLLLSAVAWIVMSVCAVAQNNPYKINDRLYPLYRRAFQQRVSKEGLALADQLYAEATKLRDGKARCLARTIPLLNHYNLMDDDQAFDRAVDELKAEALATGYKQYYYFALTNQVNYLLNQRKDFEAFNIAQDFTDKAQKEHDMDGIYYGLCSVAQVHLARKEILLAINAFEEAKDIGKRYLPDQDIATIYRRLAECYNQRFDYERSYQTAKTGYGFAKTDANRLRLLRLMAFAKLKLQDYNAVKEICQRYEKLNGPLRYKHVPIMELEMYHMKCIADKDYAQADKAYKQYDTLQYLENRLRISMESLRREGDYRKYGTYRERYYWQRIYMSDSVRTHSMSEMHAHIFNHKIELDNQHLLAEHERMLYARRQAELNHTNLELANTRLSLRNSNLELGRTRAAADMLRLSAANKRLEASQLKSRLSETRAQHRAVTLRIWTIIACVAIALIATVMYLRIHRSIMQRLKATHRRLAHNHHELTEARNRAEAASQVKTDVLRGMTDDLNIPLNSIAGFAQLIADTTAKHTPGERREYFQQIRANTDQLLRIVDNALNEAQSKQ